MFEMTKNWVGMLLDEISNQGDSFRVRETGDAFLLEGPGDGRVFIRGGRDTAWAEVTHVAALDVLPTHEAVAAVGTASVESPASAVLIDGAIIARHVLHAADIDQSSLERAITETYRLSARLCHVVVGELGAGRCPDALEPRGPTQDEAHTDVATSMAATHPRGATPALTPLPSGPLAASSLDPPGYL